MAGENLSGGRNQGVAVLFEDNAFYQNSLAGIRVRGNMPVTIRTCKVHSNGRAGIAIDRQANVTVTDCDVYENGRGGVNVDEAEQTIIEQSRIYQNRMAGVRVWRSGGKASDVLDVVAVSYTHLTLPTN